MCRGLVGVGLALSAIAAAVSVPRDVVAHGGETFVIRVNDGGFTPPTLEIRQGDTVTFENMGKTPRWPASNIHPTHEVYPEFDPKRPIEGGGRWSFTFDRAGEWRFHDHLQAELGGSITVRARGDAVAAAPARGLIPSVPGALRSAYEAGVVGTGRLYYRLFPGRLDEALGGLDMRAVAARDEALRYWLAVAGPERLMANLLRKSRGGSAFDCHQEAHQIGRVAYGLYAAGAFQRGEASCHAGYYHGAMEAFLQEQGTRNLAADIDALCKSFETRFGRFQCLHGVGHGVMAYEDYDLPKALDTCARLKGRYAQGACQEGAFMENVVAAQGLGALRAHKTKWVSQDPHFPCNAIRQDPALQFHCYQMQTSWMLTLYHYDFERVAEECVKTRGDMVPVCFKSLGRDIAAQTLRKPGEIVARCDRVPRVKDSYDQCIAGAVNVIVDFWGGKLGDQATELCRLVPAPSKGTCYAVVASRLVDVFRTPVERRRVCEGFEPPYQRLCDGV